jgi:hypothetical protein
MRDPGWRRIQHPALGAWAEAALPLAEAALAADPTPRRHGGTWAVGLDLLPNAASGRIGGVDLPWEALGLAPEPLHKAQLSTVFPGYPGRDPEESAAAHGFRLRRDAAHVDGLLALGPQKRRFLKEPHGWVLGLALNAADPGAAPLVVWEGSAEVIGAAFVEALAPHPPETWGDVDLTEAYQAARARCFATCTRVELPQTPGEAVLLDRRTLHGVAPWAAGAKAPPAGRIVAYFRPVLGSVAAWLGRESTILPPAMVMSNPPR